MSVERDVWRSPDGRYRLVAVVVDTPRGIVTHYHTEALTQAGRWRHVESWEALAVLRLLARQLDRDAGEERAG